jgi:hypothetical protein
VVLLVRAVVVSVPHVHIVSRYVSCCHINSSTINEFDLPLFESAQPPKQLLAPDKMSYDPGKAIGHGAKDKAVSI